MCGRITLTFDDDFYKRYETVNKIDYKPRYNVRPSELVPVVVSHSPNSIQFMVWGLVPFWDKSEKPKGLINMRDDTIQSKAWAKRYIANRCIIGVPGFFEWKKPKTADKNKKSTPYYIHLKHEKYFSLGGLHTTYKHPKTGREVETFAIITTSPNDTMSPIHHRMPLIIDKKDEARWLNPDIVELEHLKDLFKPYPDTDMEAYIISDRVNKYFDDAGVIEPQTNTTSMFE